jgi:hypothetical protein
VFQKCGHFVRGEDSNIALYLFRLRHFGSRVLVFADVTPEPGKIEHVADSHAEVVLGAPAHAQLHEEILNFGCGDRVDRHPAAFGKSRQALPEIIEMAFAQALSLLCDQHLFQNLLDGFVYDDRSAAQEIIDCFHQRAFAVQCSYGFSVISGGFVQFDAEGL